jgi:hypothetical protein
MRPIPRHLALIVAGSLIVGMGRANAGTFSSTLSAKVTNPAYANMYLPVVINMVVPANLEADTDALARTATSRPERVAAIVSALQQEAETVQTTPLCGGSSIRQHLAGGMTAGTAKGWKALWLIDALTAEAKPALLNEIVQRPDVGLIELSDAMALPEPVEANGCAHPGWSITRVGATTSSNRGAGAIVGIIDTGVNGTHNDLRSRCIGGPSGVTTCEGETNGTLNVVRCETGPPAGRCVGPQINRATGLPYWLDAAKSVCQGGALDGAACDSPETASACESATPAGVCVGSATPVDDHGRGSFMTGVAVG